LTLRPLTFEAGKAMLQKQQLVQEQQPQPVVAAGTGLGGASAVAPGLGEGSHLCSPVTALPSRQRVRHLLGGHRSCAAQEGCMSSGLARGSWAREATGMQVGRVGRVGWPSRAVGGDHRDERELIGEGIQRWGRLYSSPRIQPYTACYTSF